jgi:hypothetical protein
VQRVRAADRASGACVGDLSDVQGRGRDPAGDGEGVSDPTSVIAEVEHERFWRYRCGEPAPGHYPVRCRRDLSHPDGHVGIGARVVSALSERPMRWESTYVTWPGTGNPVSAQVGDGYRCWCTLKREPKVGWWAITEHPCQAR